MLINFFDTPMKAFKICVAGASKTGKSSFVQQYVEERFEAEYISTIGALYKSKEVEINGETYDFQIWDLGGEQKYRSITPMFFRGCSSVLLFFAFDDLNSFQEIDTVYLPMIDSSVDINKIQIFLVGNKCDIANSVVSLEEAQAFARSHHMDFYEISCQNSATISSMMAEIERKIISSGHDEIEPSVRINDHPPGWNGSGIPPAKCIAGKIAFRMQYGYWNPN